MQAGLTIFTIPKGFDGHIGVIQRNALASWRRLGPQVHIVLFGDDPGVAEAATECGARHVPDIAKNEYGTPLVSDAFTRMRRLAETPLLMYSNSDLLYDQTLIESAKAVGAKQEFLMSGQCWDTKITADIDPTADQTWRSIFRDHKANGQLRGPAGMDFFIFPRETPIDMPELAVGRPGWDCWLAWHCLMKGIPLINATRSVIAIHQNHDYSSLRLGYQHRKGPERELNNKAAGGLSNMLTLREANWHLVGGRLERPPLLRRLPSLLARQRMYQLLLGLKRLLQ
jgi:hypothetical protein